MLTLLVDMIPSSTGHRAFISIGWLVSQLNMFESTTLEEPSPWFAFEYSYHRSKTQ